MTVDDLKGLLTEIANGSGDGDLNVELLDKFKPFVDEFERLTTAAGSLDGQTSGPEVTPASTEPETDWKAKYLGLKDEYMARFFGPATDAPAPAATETTSEPEVNTDITTADLFTPTK